MKFFLVKRKTSDLGTTLLKYRIIRISELSDVRLKEFCCTYWRYGCEGLDWMQWYSGGLV
jgi:hypothetical protein